MQKENKNALILALVNEHAKSGKSIRDIQGVIACAYGDGLTKEGLSGKEKEPVAPKDVIKMTDSSSAAAVVGECQSHASRMATIFKTELEEIRRDDVDFTGTANQVANLREILVVDTHLADSVADV